MQHTCQKMMNNCRKMAGAFVIVFSVTEVYLSGGRMQTKTHQVIIQERNKITTSY